MVLDFTLLWEIALKCVPRTMAYHGIQSADCHKEKNCTTDCHEENNRNADYLSQDSTVNLRADCQEFNPVVANCDTFESGLPKGYPCFGKPRYWSVVCHNRLISSFTNFTSAVPLFDALFIFDARLLDRCKTYTRRIG
jgi:hypothetical protein